MRIEENQISDLFNSLTAEEQEDLLHRLKGIYSSEFSLAPEALAVMKMEQLMPVRDIIRGYVLTKKNAPNILQAYAALDTSKLPRKISFGRLPEPPHEEN